MALRSSTDRVGLLAIETTYGTPATIAAANAILLMNSQIQPAADKLERNIDKPYFGGDPFVLVNKRVTLTADIDLLGPASASLGDPAPMGVVYRTCGHAETLIATTSAEYNPISKDFESATVDFYWAGIKFRMTGVRGYMDMSFNIKQYAMGKINLTGLLTIPTDGEAPSGIDWSAFQTPPAVDADTWTVTVGGTDVCAQSLDINANATVNLIECSNAREVAITERKPAGTLKVYKDATLATWNPWSVAEAQSVVTLQNNIVGGAGLNLTMPILAQLEYPQPTDIDGVAGFDIPFTCVPSGAGGDEYSLLFT